jgi:hypothetical protein
MKYLHKYNESSLDNSQIELLCKEHRIENYIINADGTIDVDGNVDLYNLGLTELPLKFREVTGDFDCSFNKLTTLEGAPKSVGGKFDCSYNNLTTLKGAPQSVDDDFYCFGNKLTTLEGYPKLIGGKFDCSHNPIVTESYFKSYIEILKRVNNEEIIPNTLITPGLLALLKEKNPEVYKKVKELTDEESTKIKDILGDFGFD